MSREQRLPEATGGRDPLRSSSRREREIMQVLLEAGEAAVAQVWKAIPAPPSYDAVRTTLRILEQKGMVRHRQEGRRYLYSPTLDIRRAQEGALTDLVRTFFSGSPGRAALALLRRSDLELDEEEIQRIERRLQVMEESEGG